MLASPREPVEVVTAQFHTTRWSLVARTGDGDAATAQRALGELCEQYWQPLYSWLRRSGRDEAAALDLVQAFCAQLLDRGGLDGADRTAGPFRAYLLGALRNFVANEARREQTRRRGGGVTTWSWDQAEARYALEPRDDASPERAYERRWAQALLDRATLRLRDEYAARGRQALLLALEPALLGDEQPLQHREVADRLGTTEGAVRVALHRARSRLRELIRDEVAQTLTDRGGVDDELRSLFSALGGERGNPPPGP